MHVTIVGSALPGLGPQAVLDRASAAWRLARPQDALHLLPASTGTLIPHVGTGIDDVARFHHPDARAVEVGGGACRRVHVTWGTHALIDLADSFTWSGQWRGSTAFLGEDLRSLMDAGLTHVHLHLPQLMSPSDLGLGMLGELAGIEIAGEPRDLSEALTRARSALGDLAISATYSADLPLLGVNGMARLWALRGFDGLEAQEVEKQIGGWVHELERAASAGIRRSLLGANVDPRAGFAGPGGGLGLMLSLLGASMSPIGDVVVGELLEPTDLIVYVCDAIGVDLPTGLHAAARYGEEEGIPVVLLTDSAGIRRGELPRLGLHGAYELRPERAFLDDDDDLESIARLGELLTNAVHTLAGTWGWD